MPVKLFGSAHNKSNGTPYRGLPAKARIAIALIHVKFNGTAERIDLAQLLWETQSDKSANANLRQMLLRVRKFEAKYKLRILSASGRFVRLSHDSSDLMLNLNAIKSLTNAKELSEYITSYHGEFLKGSDTFSEPELRGWIQTQRQEFSSRFLQIVMECAVNIGGDAGIRSLEYLLSIHPYDETVLQSLILTYSRNENLDPIWQIFKKFDERLQNDLDVKPSKETLNLVAQLCPDLIPVLAKKNLRAAATPNGANPATKSKVFDSTLDQKKGSQLPRIIILPPWVREANITLSNKKSAENLIEELTLCLCRARSFVVLAPHTANQFAKLRSSRKLLDVDYTISTKLLESKNHSVLVVILTSVLTSEVLLSSEIPIDSQMPYDNLSSLIQFIADGISQKIDQTILSAFRYSGEISAYTFYLIGQSNLNTNRLASVRAARKAFKQAIRHAPDFYAAKQMLASTYHREWFLLGRQDRDQLTEAKRIAKELITTDPLAPGGHWELSIALLYLDDISEAQECISKAILSAPHHADIFVHQAEILAHIGHHQKALDTLKIAKKFNPIPPDLYYWNEASCQFFLEEYDQCLRTISQLSEIVPLNARLVAACHAMLGNRDQASYFRKMHLSEHPEFSVADWPKTYTAKNKSNIDQYMSALRLAGFH